MKHTPCIRKLIAMLIAVATAISMGVGNTALAQSQALEEIIVTATKRDEVLTDVPISISNLSGNRLDNRFDGGESILAIASAAPGLYAESSNGRHAPRFYMRGLGNSDFDQAASQPVSIVFDEVAMEQVTFKAFPIFDVGNIEVIRGPQGTLYGRNTTAGIVKINSRRPEQETSGYIKGSVGSLATFTLEGAVGGALTDNLSGRISFLRQDRDNWIDNVFTGENDAIGGFDEFAGRVQLLWQPSDNFSALLSYQKRDLGGNSASAFRANTITPGTNDLNSNFDRKRVFYDGGGGNVAEIDADGLNVTLEWAFGNHTLTSITSFQDAQQFARGDIDGGIVDPTLSIATPAGISCIDAGFVIPIFGPARTCPDFIFISSDTGGNNDAEQFSQEFRLASDNEGSFNYQVGAFFFSDELSTSTEFGIGPGAKDTVVGSIALHENDTFAVFAQGSWDLTDQTNITVGIRYTDDEKDYIPTLAPPTQAAVNLQDDNVSWDVSLSHSLSESSQVYGRIAAGFRAPSIQARNAAFGGPVTTADSETILSYEVGYKSDVSDSLRFSAAAFLYDIDDMQLTAIGGGGNFTTLLNAEGGSGVGFEAEFDWVLNENFILSAGFGYADTETEDGSLSVTPGIGAATVLDPINADGNAIIDGNPFQHAPEWTLNVELSYEKALQDGNQVFFFTDWKFKGDTNEFLYESVEYNNDSQFEAGLRFGYRNIESDWEVAVFGRNITDEENAIGGIDFSNATSFVNEPAIWGIQASKNF